MTRYATAWTLSVAARSKFSPNCNGNRGSLHPQQHNCCVYPSACVLVCLHVPNHNRLVYYTNTHIEPNRKSPYSLLQFSQLHFRLSYIPYSIPIPITSPSQPNLSPPSFVSLLYVLNVYVNITQHMSLQKNKLKIAAPLLSVISPRSAHSVGSGKQKHTNFQTYLLLWL